MRGKCPKDKGGTVPFAKRGGRGSEATAGGARGGRGISRQNTLRYPTNQESHHDPPDLTTFRRTSRTLPTPPRQALEVFGSAAVGNFNPDTSDIDFLVDYQPFPAGGKADAYFGLLEDLQRLFDRRVDLVVDRAIENPYFRQNVDKSKVAVYES